MMQQLVVASLVAGCAAEWEHLGPRNIFNDAAERGESGTLADAASPAANPQLIYTEARTMAPRPGSSNQLTAAQPGCARARGCLTRGSRRY
jgi:hypothetical protein